MSQRSVELRKSVYLNPSELRLPFAHIQKQFGFPLESILRKIHCEPVVHLGIFPNTFPYTNQEYYWISTYPGIGSWIALGKMTNGLYFLYVAKCNVTGKFMDGNGSMCLWISTRYSSLIHFAMDETIYRDYINETVP